MKSFVFTLFSVLILGQVISFSRANEECSAYPNVSIKEYYPITNVTKLNESVYFFPDSVILLIECNSKDPIYWDFSKNPINQQRFVNLERDVTNALNISTFCFKAIITLYAGKAITGQYSCRNIENPGVQASIFVYIQGGNPPYLALAVKNKRVIKQINEPEITENWVTIPCLVSNPQAQIQLYKEVQGRKEGELLDLHSDRLRWNPLQGFLLNTNDYDYIGRYTCFEEFMNENRSVFIDIHPPSDSHSQSKAKITYNINTYDITCETFSRSIVTSIFKRCFTISDCQNAAKRQRDDSIDVRGSPCESLNGNSCSKSAQLHDKPYGIVQCLIEDSKSKDYVSPEFMHWFTGLTGFKYGFINWKEIKVIDIVRITTHIPYVLYSGENLTMECEGARFLVADGLQWLIGLKNGSVYGKHNLRFTESIHISMDDTRTVSKVTIPIWTMDIVKISCLAPLWNSTEWINASVRLNIQESTPPKIFQHHTSKITVSFHETKEVHFTCEAEGKPIPDLTWSKGSSHELLPAGVVELDPTINISITKILSFQAISPTLQGEYICTASSIGRKVEKVYKIIFSQVKRAWIVGVVIGALIVIIVLAIIVVYLVKLLRRQKQALRQLTQDEYEKFLQGQPEMIGKGGVGDNAQFMPYKNEYEIPAQDLLIDSDRILGSGEYGVVVSGVLTRNNAITVVAVKTLKPTADKDYFTSLLSEIKIMIRIGPHVNIVNFIGAQTKEIRKGHIVIVAEFCSLGSLEKYLRAHRRTFVAAFENDRIAKEKPFFKEVAENEKPGSQIQSTELLNWSYQIANGMEYLSNKKVIHADLATRNILLTEGRIIKITDFGLSRQLYEYTNYVKKTQAPLPWRWMALESLTEMNFSTQSDVWSYGITLWEIFSLGDVPYPGLTWSNAFLQQIRTGYRPEKPEFANIDIYNILQKCWKLEPNERPRFQDLKQYVRNLASEFKSNEYTVLDDQEECCESEI